MVFAVYEPSNFGIVFPEGDYVGFYETLQAYYDNEMSDADKQMMESPDRFTAYEFVKKFTEDLGPLKDVECPKVFRLKKTPKKIGAMIQIQSGLPLVSEALKNIIETLEPGIHQFWPVSINLPRNKTLPEQYYGLRIATFLDSFRPEQSEEESWRPLGKLFTSYDSRAKAKGLAFSKDVLAGKHLWREVRLFKPTMCMSDELQQAAAEQELYLPKHYPVTVV
ncbi:imm11 family protein [Thalassobius sp. Cn5-15]|uniref:imm11 family protein n=1 Tax=Thalassobius sp. Cn5-15 TaxID=2917763 RepID=UPI001EF215BC|nr:DUF1629 domain-containing protein [Thalassobius sp. Cn5-15]MCG7495029.1 hypothetical protein [Thalassobius sp. Cn5-15]